MTAYPSDQYMQYYNLPPPVPTRQKALIQLASLTHSPLASSKAKFSAQHLLLSE